MNLVETSIKKPVFAWMLMIGLMLFGFLSFREMGVSQLPDVDMPTVNISITWSGASPEVIESDVVDVIESAVMSVEGVDSINASVSRGRANISVDFNLNKNLDLAVQDIQNRLSQIVRKLPKDIETPTVSKMNPDDQPIIWMAVGTDKMGQKELMEFVRDQIKDRFLTIDGVAEVMLSGYVDPVLRVWIDEKKLAQYQLTVSDVQSAIASEHSEIPSGLLENNQIEFTVRTRGEVSKVADFENIYINRRGGATNFAPIKLKDVAKVEDGLDDIRRKSRVMGRPSIGIGIKKQKGANASEVADRVFQRMEEVKKTLPPGMDLGVNFDTTRFIKESVHELTFTLVLSALLTAVVCWIFLGSWSATFNVILAIPTSVLGSFIVLKALGFTLNYFTLLGLSLAIGIVVDDAIMVLENIFSHFERGKNKVQASLDGAKEISFAAMAATVAIIAIFLPIAYMKGVIGKYFYQFGVTISVAVFISLIEALTLTPMRTSQFMTKADRHTKLGMFFDHLMERSEAWYSQFLPWVLNNRWKVIALSLVFFFGSFGFLATLRKEFVPAQDQAGVMIRIKTKEGSSLAFTDEKVKSVESFIMNQKETKRYFTAIGGFGGGESSSAMFFVTLTDKKERKLTQQELIDVWRDELKKIKGAKIFVQDTSLSSFAGGGGRGFPIEFSIAGSNWSHLVESVKATMEALEKQGDFQDVDSNFREAIKELTIVPDRNKARARGVAIEEIGKSMNAMIGGTTVGKFTKEGHRYDVRIKLNEMSADQLDRIGNVYVRNNRGELVRLSEVASIQFEDGLTSISRKDRMRSLTIYANLKKGVSQAKALDVAKSIASKNLKPGVMVLESGSAKTFKESFQSLIFVLVLGIIISYMVLASQFNSFIDPLIVLVALPFSVTGAFLALWLSGQSINIYSMIGIVLLMGIVKKNSILLVDFTNQVFAEGLSVKDALLKACPNRLRPILMTSIATIAGAIPAAFSLGPGAESLSPMAMSVIGGVIVSTALTLVVVPAIYSLLGFRKKVDKVY